MSDALARGPQWLRPKFDLGSERYVARRKVGLKAALWGCRAAFLAPLTTAAAIWGGVRLDWHPSRDVRRLALRGARAFDASSPRLFVALANLARVYGEPPEVWRRVRDQHPRAWWPGRVFDAAEFWLRGSEPPEWPAASSEESEREALGEVY